MANTIANDENGDVIHSSVIFNLRNKDKRVNARNEDYYCPHCETSMKYAHSGREGCFKHLPSTPPSVKESCPYYSGLLTGCSKEIALAIESKKNEVQLFLDENEITGYKLISYYSEPNLASLPLAQLSDSLISHPYHIAAVTGDACLLKPDNFGARIAFVDYDGEAAFKKYTQNPPKTKADEITFINQNAPRMVSGIDALKSYVDYLRSS